MTGRIWFRLYAELVDDPKVQRLSGETFKGLINLWCLACRNDGVLPSMEDLSYGLRMPPAKVDRLLASLTGAGLIEATTDGTVIPHNWKGRQFTSDVSTSRVKRHRERQGNGGGNGGGNADETFHETGLKRTRDRTEQNRAEKKEKKDAPKGINGHAAAPAPAAPHSDPEKDYFSRGKALLGKDSGGLLAKLLKAKDGNVALARAALETASTKQNAREYLGAIVRGHDPPSQTWDPRL